MFPTLPSSFSCNTPHPGLVIQNLELHPGPGGQIVPMFSLATEGQDSSRSQPPPQLDLAQSFTDMLVSPSTSAGGTSPDSMRRVRD
jgi:hypothetical protein